MPTTATISDEGTRCEIRLPEMIVTSEFVDESTQPWGDRPCYRYSVRVSAAAPIIGKGEFQEYAYGSQHDFEQGDNQQAQDMAWMILDDLWSAWNDPEEFFTMAFGEPDNVSLERVRGILSVIDYAEMIGRVLDLNGSEIEEARERA